MAYSSPIPLPFGQTPQMPRPQSGGMGGFLSNNPNMLLALGAQLLAHRQNAQNPIIDAPTLMVGAKADRETRDRNLTRDWLMRTHGLSSDDAAAVAGNKDLLSSYIRGETGKYGLTPFYARDAEGNLRAYQLNSAGGMEELALPDGTTPAPPMHFGDLGTSIGGMNTRTGQVETMVPKDVAGEKAAQEAGAGQGKAISSLPLVVESGNRLISAIDDALNDPALGRVTGPFQSWLPNMTGEAQRAQSRLNMILGGTFLQAYNDLRGAGQITEREGEAAQQAYNRLFSTGMSDADYREALAEFKRQVERLMEIARLRAASAAPPELPPQQSTPDASDLYRRYGLEP